MAVQNAGSVFTYFCGGHKNDFWLQFRSSSKKSSRIVLQQTYFQRGFEFIKKTGIYKEKIYL